MSLATPTKHDDIFSRRTLVNQQKYKSFLSFFTAKKSAFHTEGTNHDIKNKGDNKSTPQHCNDLLLVTVYQCIYCTHHDKYKPSIT